MSNPPYPPIPAVTSTSPPPPPPPPQGARVTAAQEIRARALDAAVRAFAPWSGADDEGRERGEAIAEVAAAFEAYIRDGHTTDVTNG